MTSGTAIAIRDFTLLLPPGWVRLPLDDRLPIRLKQLVESRIRHAPPQHQAGLRSSLGHELSEAARAAAAQGGLDMLLSLDAVADVVVPASALVTHLDVRGQDGGLAELYETMTAQQDGLEIQTLAMVDVAGAPAVRRLGTRIQQVPAAGSLPAGTLMVTQLEYVVPLPGTDSLLVLTFATPCPELAVALVSLFDVMAQSLRWVRS